MTGWLLAPGTSLALLGDGWVAYSASSGESHLLNDESVAVLEALDDVMPRTVREICADLNQDLQMEASALEAILQPSWNSLVEAGLVREAAESACL